MEKIENLKLFTEYDRQYHRKYPGLSCEIKFHKYFDKPMARLVLDILHKGKIYVFSMTAQNPAVNGDITCTLENVDGPICDFAESRKPMEMNVDNLVNAARCYLETK